MLFNIESPGSPNCSSGSYDIQGTTPGIYTITIADCTATAFGATLNGTINVTDYTTTLGSPQPITGNTENWAVKANINPSNLEFRVNNKTTIYSLGFTDFEASYFNLILVTSLSSTSNTSVIETLGATAGGTSTKIPDELRTGFKLTSTYDSSSEEYSLEASGKIVSRVTANLITITTTTPFKWLKDQINPYQGSMSISDSPSNQINITGSNSAEVQVAYSDGINNVQDSFDWF